MCNLQCAYCSGMVRRRWWWLWCAVSQVSPPHIHLSPKLHLPHIAPSAAPGGEARGAGGEGVEPGGDGEHAGAEDEDNSDDKE